MMQRKMCLLILLLLLSAFSANAKADYATGLEFQGYIGNVDVGEFSVPVAYDWNNDGLKDLIVGSRTGSAQTGYHGYIKYYENTGTNSAPSFSSSSDIQSCTLTCSAIDSIAGG